MHDIAGVGSCHSGTATKMALYPSEASRAAGGVMAVAASVTGRIADVRDLSGEG